jgi:hypothetical protein
VVYESVVWQYLTEPEQDEVVALMQEAATRATPEAPLAWLRLEPHERPDLGAELRLTLWPGDGEERVLALCGYHGTPVRWHDPVAA